MEGFQGFTGRQLTFDGRARGLQRGTLQEFFSVGPGLFLGFANDDLQARAEGQLTADFRGFCCDLAEFLTEFRRGVGEAQVHVEQLHRMRDTRPRRARAPQWDARLLLRRMPATQRMTRGSR
ncbi:hypothetical protein D3C84_714830 [compost metagenome]